MKRSIHFFVLAVVIGALSFASEVGAQTEVKFIKIATASPGGLWYLAGAALATEIHKNFPNIETSSTGGGSIANAKAVNKATEIHLAFNNTAVQDLAFQGKAPFDTPNPDIRMIGTMETMFGHFVVPRSLSGKIKSFYDLKDKRVNIGRIGSLERQSVIVILKHHGITPESMKANRGTVHALSFNDATEMLRDGHLDFTANTGAIVPFMVDLDTSPGLHWLPLAGKERERVLADLEMKGWSPGVLKKGWFAGISEDIPTIQVKTTVIVNKNMPEDLVYRLTKILYESGFHKEIFAAQEGKGLPKAFNLQDLKEAASIPMHPGALRYFKEKGISL